MSGQVLSLHELSQLLAKRLNCDEATASEFLKGFSTVVTQGLAAEGRVDVAGLGTFRTVTDVTGNPGVEFAPEKDLAQTVNEPFAMFEPVELADSLTDEELTQPAEAEKPVLPPPLPPRFSRKPEPQPESHPEPLTEPLSQPQPEPQPEPELTESRPEPALPSTFPEPELSVEGPAPIAQPTEPESIIPPTQPEPFVQPTQPEPTPAPAPSYQPPQYPAYQDNAEQNPLAVRLEPESSVTIERVGHTTLTLVVAAIAALLAGLIIGYFSYKWLNNPLPGNVEFTEEGILIRNGESTGETPVLQADDADARMEEDLAGAAIDALTDTTSQTSETEANTAEVPAPAQTAPKVVTDTVGPGNYLSVMARRHYGNSKFWVYIYLENKDNIRNPDNLENGMVLVIPPASKYGIDANNPESVKKAEREAYKVLDP